MDRTTLACGFVITKTTSVKAAFGIFKQLFTLGAKLLVAFLLAAIKTYHLFYNSLLFLDVFLAHYIILYFCPQGFVIRAEGLCGFLLSTAIDGNLSAINLLYSAKMIDFNL